MAKDKTPKKGNLVSAYLTEVKEELRQVSWPSRQEATRLTLMVIGVSLLVGAYLGALDYLFTYAIGLII